MIDLVEIIGFNNCLKIKKRLKEKCPWKQLKIEFRHIEEDVLKSYVKRILRTQNNYLYDEISNRYQGGHMNKRTIITILSILTLMLTLYRLEIKKRDKNDIDKLYHTSTRSGRPIIYLKDN